MDLLILEMGETLEKIGVVDEIKSLIWIRKYHVSGSFELVVPANEKNISLIKKHRILHFGEKRQAGFIENINIKSDEDGIFITATGCFLLGLLARRYIVQNCRNLVELLNQNVINCSNSARNIPLITLSESLENLTFENDVRGKGLTEMLEALSRRENIGFGIAINFEAKKLEFYSYKGLDRSYLQSENPRAIFAKEYDNLLSTEYTNSDAGAVNSVVGVCKIPAGVEPYGEAPAYSIDAEAGIKRQEIFVETEAVTYNVKRIQRIDKAEIETTEIHLNRAATLANMKADCEAALVSVAENIEAVVAFKNDYRKKYDLGDIVEVRDKRLTVSLTARICEVTEIYDNVDNAVIPLFGSPAATIMDILKSKK